ncbi:MAG TPA: VOC family protein [Vibrio sp.]|uniref:VOC family protein n=1 Tax=Vibrio TaxID=662 RepID=UPI000404E7A3|nr:MULTISPECIES: VOC family protein [Vibrio]HCH01635.1 VOC family protein [Vibrio sp.]
MAASASTSLSPNSLFPTALLADLPRFWGDILTLAGELGIETQSLVADHIAMRINDLEVAKNAHQQWLTQGRQISNAMINGRPIIVIEFDKPVKVENHNIECLELPYPSDKTYPNEGWEHVEFVVPSFAKTAQEFVEEVKAVFPQLAANWDSLAEKGVKVKLSSPQGEGERLANPTVAFKKNGVCIKLHPHTLKEVIASEQA